MQSYKIEFEVRDNEIDLQGVVNNANYYIYFAHARHKFIKEIGISFSEMSEKNQYLFLTSSTIEFKKPLKAEEKFYVTCQLVPEGNIRFAFKQEIRKLPDDALIAKSYNVGACVDGNNRNRPYIPEIIKNLFSITEITLAK